MLLYYMKVFSFPRFKYSHSQNLSKKIIAIIKPTINFSDFGIIFILNRSTICQYNTVLQWPLYKTCLLHNSDNIKYKYQSLKKLDYQKNKTCMVTILTCTC